MGDADNSPTFRHGYVRELPYIQPLWKRYCDNFANKAVENLEDIQGNLDDDIGVEHIVNANAGLLANAVRGLSPWAATSLRAEQRLEFQVSCPTSSRLPCRAMPHAARCRLPHDTRTCTCTVVTWTCPCPCAWTCIRRMCLLLYPAPDRPLPRPWQMLKRGDDVRLVRLGFLFTKRMETIGPRGVRALMIAANQAR